MRAGTAVAFLLAACALVSDAQAQLRLREQASGFTYPLAFVQDPTDRAAQFVVAHRNSRLVHCLRSPCCAAWSKHSTLQATIERSF